MEDDTIFVNAIEIKQAISETKKEIRKESKSEENSLDEQKEIENCNNPSLAVKTKKRCCSDLDKLHDDIEEMLLNEKIMLTGSKHCYMMKQSNEDNLNKLMEEGSDIAKILITDKELPLPVFEKVVPVSSPDDSACKKIGKRKNMWTFGITQKKVRNGDWSSKMDKIENEKDDGELNDSKYDKKYFFLHSTKICCKLCSFKGKFIVHHYRTSHPETEVFISRINPYITDILIEDAVQNREEYDRDHPEVEKVMYNFKCPFCLMLIKDTSIMHYNHISSHTGEYCFHCNHCSYWTYNYTNIRSHLNQMHYKIQKTEYKMVYLDMKISKYIFGYICSECNFVQLIRTAVEEHAMVYHSGMPEVYKVNLGVLVHGSGVDENHTNEIHSNENYLNLNCINSITSGPGETEIQSEAKELRDLLVQMKELEEIKVKIEPAKLDDDPCPIELATFICQPDLDIKQESENDKTKILQWINKNMRNAKTSVSDRMQIKSVTEVVEESEKIQSENIESTNMNEKLEKHNKAIDSPEQPEKAKKSIEVIEIGPISVIKALNVFTFHCKIQNCNYASEDKKAFAIHCEVTHKDFLYIFNTEKCNICSIKFEYNEKFITVYDIYLHIVTAHKDFFKLESALSFKSMNNVPNVLSQTYSNLRSEFPFIISNVAGDRGKTFSSEMKLPMITSVQSLGTNTKQLVSMNEDDLRCASVVTDIPMTVTEKQNKKCPKAVAVMMNPSLLKALYKCPNYDCSFATTLPLSFQKHFAIHYSTLMDTLVPCLYCDYKVSYSSYVIHLEVRHGHCLFGCSDCFYRTTNSYFVTMHRELVHPNTEFNILQLQVVNSNKIRANTMPANLIKLVAPYNCKDDGFLSCPFKTLYFEKYLKHVEAIHHVDELSLFSSERESQKEVIMEGWLAKEVGPFQCGYCKKASVTHQEMGSHQAVFHAQEQCLFYYRKFVPNDTVIIPEQVNLEDPSFINHVIHLPDQVHLCDFKLTDGLLSSISAKLRNGEAKVSCPLLPPLAKDIKTKLDGSTASLDEPEIFSVLVKDEARLLDESDSLDDGAHNDVRGADCKLQCKWKGCYQTYNSQMALVKHIEQNHVQLLSTEEFTCFWVNCPRKFKPYTTKQNLLIHMRVHSGEKPYKCAECNKPFSHLVCLRRHREGHTRTYLCQFSSCLKSFSHSSERDEHQRIHHNTMSYTCQVTGCSVKYADLDSLQKHMKNHVVDNQIKLKSVENKQKEGDIVLNKSSNSLDGTRQQTTYYHTCKWKDCCQIYDSQTAFVKHIEDNHVQLQRGEVFTCFWNNCARKLEPYTTKRNLLYHMSVHSGEKAHKCPFQGCNKAFSQLGNLKIHQKNHTGEKPYFCQFSECLKSFSHKSNRNKHQRTHYNRKPYACPVTDCLKEYADGYNLRRHMKNHSADEQAKVKHKSVKQEEEDFVLKKPFGNSDGDKHQGTYCDICKWKGCYQVYDSQTVLVKHIEKNHVQSQSGKGFICFWNNCPRKLIPYKRRCHLLLHMRIHSGEKPYKCAFQGCNKAFSQRGHLKVHQRSHTEERPYLCQFSNCFKSFSTSLDRDYHQKMHYDVETYASSLCQPEQPSETCEILESRRET